MMKGQLDKTMVGRPGNVVGNVGPSVKAPVTMKGQQDKSTLAHKDMKTAKPKVMMKGQNA